MWKLKGSKWLKELNVKKEGFEPGTLETAAWVGAILPGSIDLKMTRFLMNIKYHRLVAMIDGYA